MDIAVQSLSVKPDKALIDGFSVDKLSVPNEGIIKGDNIEISIMKCIYNCKGYQR